MSQREPELISVHPVPEAAVIQAIEQAVMEVWPKPVPAGPEPIPSWRFSGRWWAQPAALRRDRPLSTI